MELNFLSLDHSATKHEISNGAYSEDDLISALDKARNLQVHSAQLVPRIIDVLRETGSLRLRNAAALTLADLKDPRGIEVLVEVLRRPEIANAAGTLIHALDEMGATLPFDVLASIVVNGSYEARAMALMLLDDGRIGAIDPAAEVVARQSLVSLAARAR